MKNIIYILLSIIMSLSTFGLLKISNIPITLFSLLISSFATVLITIKISKYFKL